MAKRTYYGLRLLLNEDRLDHNANRALRLLCERDGRFVSLSVMADMLFGVEQHRTSNSAKRIEDLRYALDELSELNPDLIESGDLDPVLTYGYRLTEKAVNRHRREDRNS